MTPAHTEADAASAFIAVDLGSSSGRVMLGVVTPGEQGSCALERVYRFASITIEGNDGLLAWDAPSMFEQTLLGIGRAVALARERQLAILGIGVDAWGVDYGRIDREGRLQAPVRHHRAADPGMPSRSAALVDPQRAYAITGVLDQAINTSHQLRGDAEHGRVGGTMLLVPDLWVYWLTGSIAAERTIASTTQLLDRQTGDWSGELVEAWGIDAILPPLVDDGHHAGATLRAITEAVGADQPLPVYYVASHDTASAFAATVGVGGSAEVTGVVSSGSWAVAGVANETPVLTEEARGLGFTQELGVGGSTLVVRNLSGMWLLQECIRTWTAEDARAVDLTDLIVQAARAAHPATIDVADERLQRPGDLPERIAELCAAAGHPRPRDRSQVVRVIVQSLARAYADTLHVAASLVDRRLVGIRLVGGGARNALLCQLTADAASLPVAAGPAEASSLGIVYRLAVAAGVLPDLEAARSLRLTADDPFALFSPALGRRAS